MTQTECPRDVESSGGLKEASAEARNTTHFERRKCANYIVGLQSEPGWSKNTALYFAESAGTLLNGPENMTVTLRGCEEFCGPRSWYWDAGPRIMTWIIPVLLLLSNIELSPIDKKRFMTVVHALGDPIDSFWSIIHKMYIWHRLYEIGLQNSPESLAESEYRTSSATSKFWMKWLKARRSVLTTLERCLPRVKPPKTNENPETQQLKSTLPEIEAENPDIVTADVMTRQHHAQIIATVLCGFEEISGSKIKTEVHYHMNIRKLLLDKNGVLDKKMFEEWRKCARILADARTNEYLRTCLAIAVYFLGLIAAFVPSLGGGNTSPPGGRIGSALFLSWLVPLTLLSNRMGTFTSRRACLHIMREFISATRRIETSRMPSAVNVEDVSPTENPRPCFMSGGLINEDVIAKSPKTSAPKIIVQEKHIKAIHLDSVKDGAVARTGDVRTRILSAPTVPAASAQTTKQKANFVTQEGETDVGPNFICDKTPLSPGSEEYYHGRGLVIEMKSMECKKHNQPQPILAEPQFATGKKPQTQIGLIRHATWDDYFSSLQWLGAIYTYRPWKVQYKHIDHRTHARRNNGLMALAGLFPVLVSAVGASAILWYAVPIGFSCRSVWIVVIFGLWTISAAITTSVYVYSDRKEWSQEEKGSRHSTDQWQAQAESDPDNNKNNPKTPDPERKLWLFILTKDAIIAGGCLATIFLSTAGIFNSCYCWSVYMTKHEKAVVPLATDETYADRANRVYSGIVLTCIGVQAMFFFAVTLYWSGTLRLVRWNEKDKEQEWAHESDKAVMWTRQSLLLFWYYAEELEKQEETRRGLEEDYQLTRQPTFVESHIRGSIPEVIKRMSRAAGM
ncbi:hypothetical protein BKA65DRAFT_573850 [Rhexocercosporidium sp. MPI-PUGE-AT-0058]|nr:hypothetical protein BKA65DRAFT_573850 [Rhexocercosporidium sp. MPI-PUGE-AT-0058]